MAGRPRIVSVRAPSVGTVARGELLLHSAALQSQSTQQAPLASSQTIPALAQALQRVPQQAPAQPQQPQQPMQPIPALAQSLQHSASQQNFPASQPGPALAQALQHASQQNAAGATQPAPVQNRPQQPQQAPVQLSGTQPPATGEPQFPPLHNPAPSSAPKIVSQVSRRPGDYSDLVARARQEEHADASQALRERASSDILPLQPRLDNPIQLPGHEEAKKEEKNWSLENAPYRLGKMVRGLLGGNLGS